MATRINIAFVRTLGTYTLSNIVATGIPFLLLPLLTRVLTPQDYGIVAMFGVVVSVFGAMAGLGSNGAVEVRYFELGKASMASYVSACLWILVVSVLTLLLVTWLSADILQALTAIPSDWILMCVVVAALQFVTLLRLSIWQVEGKAGKYALMQVSQSGLNAALSVLLVLGLGLAWAGRLWGIALSAGLMGCVALRSLSRDQWLTREVQRDHLHDALRFGAPLVLHLIGGLLISTMDRWILTNLLGVAQTGIYSVALQIGMVISLITGAANKAYAPWLFRHLAKQTDLEKIRLVRYTYAYFLGILGLALLIGLAAPVMLSVLVGHSFQAASTIVPFVAIGYAFGGMYFMVTNYIFVAGATARLSLITVTAGAINLLCTYWLVQSHGISGAGYGFMVSQLFLFLGTWALAHRVHPMPWLKALYPRQVQIP